MRTNFLLHDLGMSPTIGKKARQVLGIFENGAIPPFLKTKSLGSSEPGLFVLWGWGDLLSHSLMPYVLMKNRKAAVARESGFRTRCTT